MQSVNKGSALNHQICNKKESLMEDLEFINQELASQLKPIDEYSLNVEIFLFSCVDEVEMEDK